MNTFRQSPDSMIKLISLVEHVSIPLDKRDIPKIKRNADIVIVHTTYRLARIRKDPGEIGESLLHAKLQAMELRQKCQKVAKLKNINNQLALIVQLYDDLRAAVGLVCLLEDRDLLPRLKTAL